MVWKLFKITENGKKQVWPKYFLCGIVANNCQSANNFKNDFKDPYYLGQKDQIFATFSSF